MSRYAAREAIKRLAGENLVVVVDGKGSYVRVRRKRASLATVDVARQVWRCVRPGYQRGGAVGSIPPSVGVVGISNHPVW
ncbi:MAG: hypothetical protein ACRDSF_26310 [Pseudonocardiaceae bacterium]